MTKIEQEEIYAKPWFEPETQRQGLPTLERLLQLIGSQRMLAVGRALLDVSFHPWLPSDVRGFEDALSRFAANLEELRQLTALLRRVVIRYRQHHGRYVLLPRAIVVLQPEIHPAQRLIGLSSCQEEKTSKWDDLWDRNTAEIEQLLDRAAFLAEMPGSEPGPVEMAAFSLLSLIRCGAILDEEFVSPLMEALANKSAWLQPDVDCMLLFLKRPSMLEQDAETRIIVPDSRTMLFLKRLSPEELKMELGSLFLPGQSLVRRRRELLELLDRELFALAGHRRYGFRDLLRSAGGTAFQRLPPLVAAHRIGRVVSHAPGKDVWRRLMNLEPVASGASKITEIGAAASVPASDAPVHDEEDPLWLARLRDCLRSSNKARVLSSLENYAAPEIVGRRFAEFARFRLERAGVALSTTRKQVFYVASKLGTQLGEDDPFLLGAADFEELFRAALTDDPGAESGERTTSEHLRYRRGAVAALKHFYLFLRDGAKLPALKTLSLSNLGLVPVDANFISVDEYRQVQDRVSLAVHNPHRRLQLRCFFILMFRCGLRRREALYLSTSDFGTDHHLQIRKNRLRALKTDNARRTLPLPVLLDDEELEEVRQLLDQARSTRSNMLFARQSEPSVVVAEKEFFAEARSLMHESITAISCEEHAKRLRLHHLRHSFGTWTLARLLGVEPFAKTFLAGHPLTLAMLSDGAAFRKKLFGTEDVTQHDLAAVVALMGHGSPSTTLFHYIHCLDWVLQVPRNTGLVKREHARLADIQCHRRSTGYARAARGLQSLGTTGQRRLRPEQLTLRRVPVGARREVRCDWLLQVQAVLSRADEQTESEIVKTVVLDRSLVLGILRERQRSMQIWQSMTAKLRRHACRSRWRQKLQALQAALDAHPEKGNSNDKQMAEYFLRKCSDDRRLVYSGRRQRLAAEIIEAQAFIAWFNSKGFNEVELVCIVYESDRRIGPHRDPRDAFGLPIAMRCKTLSAKNPDRSSCLSSVALEVVDISEPAADLRNSGAFHDLLQFYSLYANSLP